MDELFYIDLAQLTAGKTFDAVVPGTFMDMLGRKVIFKKTDLKKYVDNTKAAILAATTETGEVVGLPIDARGHDKGDGAGWIVDAILEDNKVRLVPKWTEIGLELIQKGIRRFFSPTVDTKNKVVLGGTLTNWPATRDKKGKVLLRPVELETDTPMLVIDEDQEFEQEEEGDLEDSLNDEMSAVHKAFEQQFMPKREQAMVSQSYIMEIFDTHAIVRDGGKHFSAAFTKDDKGNVKFEAKGKWKEVKRTWIEAALEQINTAITSFTNLFQSAEGGESEADQTTEEVISMEMTKEELTALIGEQVTAAIGESFKNAMTEMGVSAPKEGDEPDADDKITAEEFLKQFGLEGVTGEFEGEWEKAMLEIYEKTKAEGVRTAATLVSKIQREAHVTEFVNRVISGTEEVPQGLAVAPDDLQKFILGLDPDQASFIQPLLEKVVDGSGIVQYEELGHGKKQHGTTKLPELFVEKIKAGEMKVSDLDDPLLGLGDLSEYDLSEIKDKE